MKKLLVATTNQGKVREMERLLSPIEGLRLLTPADFVDIPMADENGDTFEANARLKALHYCASTGLPTISDDSGLVVDGLNGRPGIHSARYAPTDAERIAKLLGEMQGLEWPQRTARFVCAAAFAVPTPMPHILALEIGTLEGHIAFEARGNHGFGFDPVFYVDKLGCNLAQVDVAVKETISHRGRALAKLLPAIIDYMGRI